MKQENIEPQITQMGADGEGKEWVEFGFLSTWPCRVRRWSKKPVHFLLLRSCASSAVKDPVKQENIEPQITQMGADGEGKECFNSVSFQPDQLLRPRMKNLS